MAPMNKQSLTVTIDGTPHTIEAVAVAVNSKAADSGTVTYGNASSGGARTYTLDGEWTQNLEALSVLDMLWSQLGAHVPVVILPAGGVIDATHPSVSGTVIISESDSVMLGGPASTSVGDLQTFTTSWEFEAKPVWDRTP